MEYALETYGLIALLAAIAALAFGGFAKGVVGFALPMIAISGVGSVMSADMAVAAVLMPSLVTNSWQAFRAGVAPVRMALTVYWRIFAAMLPVLIIVALSFRSFPDEVLFSVMGVIVLFFSLSEFVRLKGDGVLSRNWEYAAGVASGFTGGLGGLWGPPIMMYLMLCNVPKAIFVQVMGCVFLLGTFALIGSHLFSGILRSETIGFSLLMVVPATLGMWIGVKVQDKLDQDLFKRAVLIVLVLAGLNLMRRGFLG